MNILFLSLLYHPDSVRETAALSRTGLQNQANSFQWAMINGMKGNLSDGESLSVLNSLPVGIYPRQYRKLMLKQRTIGAEFAEIGSVNLPVCKQKQRERAAERWIERWAAQSAENRMVLVYSLYLPYLRAVAAAKRKVADLKACVVVTDLPGGLGLSSGRSGLLQTIEHRMGKQSMELAGEMDGLILLTEQMAKPLSAATKKRCVIEGLTAETIVAPEAVELPQDTRPAVLYTGTLNRELGIGELLEAFVGMDGAQLWLCGRGDMEAEIETARQMHDNIRWFGFVPQAQAIYLQSKAELLINPRTNAGVYTRYSFPSKTMEYMRAGKPVLCCKLDGIPDEYDAFLVYIEPQNAQGIRAAVRAMMLRTQEERGEIGRRAREFVLAEKNNRKQGKKALDLLRSL